MLIAVYEILLLLCDITAYNITVRRFNRHYILLLLQDVTALWNVTNAMKHHYCIDATIAMWCHCCWDVSAAMSCHYCYQMLLCCYEMSLLQCDGTVTLHALHHCCYVIATIRRNCFIICQCCYVMSLLSHDVTAIEMSLLRSDITAAIRCYSCRDVILLP